MNSIRKIHLLLGCFFAPVLLFFVVSGALQTLALHKDWKSGYQAPEILKEMGNVHTGHRLVQDASHKSSVLFKGFIILASTGFTFTTILGVVMAFRFFRPKWVIWALLAAGGIVPFFLLVLG